ncbi:4-oxalocrotonate tautomerase [Polymorphobacter arshaanensis]|uniref:4-oxalocrotonate tautomerase n=1 Tax=Glacieibacterium arshaanense TaxID=2511025 RepID=A0A4Y9EM82_9SPHN|nr:tautomerase family protein [Polymorphobacter arshaanensis]TFU02923.1 4-oxalocrotonate tautomerase [Polymorphobacter arshaanensis]
MPLWKIYHPVDAFTADDKQAIARALTAVYGRVMPKFYVGVVFQAVEADNFYIGGEPHPRFVRIWVDHIARSFASDDRKTRFFEHINTVLAPWIADRGYDWEMHVDETPFELWTIQGYFPPREGTEDEKRWMAENRASPRTHP